LFEHEVDVLIESEDFGASAEVLQAFFVTVVKKASGPLICCRSLGMDWTMDGISLLAHRPSTRAYLSRNRATQDFVLGYGYPRRCWSPGTHTVYSEGLNNGQRYGRVQVVNPFLDRL